MGDVKALGHWPSPFALRMLIALHMKSVNYEYIEENLLGTKSELFLKSNPVYEKLPVLIHNGNPICESLIIVEYIDKVWSSSGSSILPSNAYENANSRFWAKYIDDKWFPALLEAVLFAETEDAKKAVAITQMEEGLVVLEEEFRKMSKGRAFFGGDDIGIVDIAIGCFLGWIQVVEKCNGIKLFTEAKTPCLLQWTHSFCSHASVKDHLHETDKLAEYAVKFRAKVLKAKATSK